MAIVKSKLLKKIYSNYPNFYKKDLEKFTNIIRDFNTFVKNDERTEQIILPLGDGFTICNKL